MSGRTASGGRRTGSVADSDSKAWASGRVLTTEQRLRKQEVDRKANRFIKKEVQDRLALLEARVLQLEEASSTPLDPPKSSIAIGNQDRLTTGSPSSAVGGRSPQSTLPVTSNVHQYWTGDAANASATSSAALLARTSATELRRLSRGDYSTIASTVLPAVSVVASEFDVENVASSTTSQGYGHPQLTDVFTAGRPTPGGRDLTMFLNRLVQHIRNISPDRVCYDDQLNQDTIISAALKGWKYALSRYEQVCPLWEVLQMVDVCLFKDCNFVDRISVLRMLHKRYLFETKNVPVQVEGPLPVWFQPHMSESLIAHEPAIDHLTWPRLRERLMGLSTDMLSNKFWALFARNLRVSWQYEPFDVLAFSPKSSLYQLSQPFENAILDIANWRMDLSFFYEFPCLADDIPRANYMPLRQITPSFGLAQNLLAQQQLQQQRRGTLSNLSTRRIAPTEVETPLYGQVREEPSIGPWTGFYA